jgi:hypothetical protein
MIAKILIMCGLVCFVFAAFGFEPGKLVMGWLGLAFVTAAKLV